MKVLLYLFEILFHYLYTIFGYIKSQFFNLNADCYSPTCIFVIDQIMAAFFSQKYDWSSL